MFYVLHGDNELERSERIADFKQKVGDETVRDLNLTVLDGRKTTLSELRHAADAIPFLADKRLVVVEDLLARLAARKSKSDDGEAAAPSGASKEFLSGLLAYLPQVPETTRLVFVEAQPLKDTHPIVKLAAQQGGKTVIECRPPADLTHWIIERAKKRGGVIDHRAAVKLGSLIGSELRRLDSELLKLITYVNAHRPITEKDVALLVIDSSQSNIFNLVDALAGRNGRQAAQELHGLLNHGENALGILAMIVRQFRLLIMAKELQPKNLTPEAVAKEIGAHPYVAKKVVEQARQFRDVAQLEAIYRRLLDIDVEIKTGQTSDALALDLLVAGLAS